MASNQGAGGYPFAVTIAPVIVQGTTYERARIPHRYGAARLTRVAIAPRQRGGDGGDGNSGGDAMAGRKRRRDEDDEGSDEVSPARRERSPKVRRVESVAQAPSISVSSLMFTQEMLARAAPTAPIFTSNPSLDSEGSPDDDDTLLSAAIAPPQHEEEAASSSNDDAPS